MPTRTDLCTVVVVVVCLAASLAGATRTRIDPSEEEPTTAQVYANYRLILGDKRHYYLAGADALDLNDVSNVLLDYRNKTGGGGDGLNNGNNNDSIPKYNFKFNSNDFYSRIHELLWYTVLSEKTALHLYDDHEEMLMSRGPQVDQELCGAHLDYMLHMIERHLSGGLFNSTEFSIFHIMNTYDTPHLGFSWGNSLFFGDYDKCLSIPLNVIRKEFDQVNKDAANSYFESGRNLPQEEPAGLRAFFNKYVLPFLGVHADDSTSYISVSKATDKLRLLPMRYCLAGLRWPQWPTNSSWSRRNSNIRVGICLPETCDSSSLDLFKDKIQKLTEFQMNKHQLGYYLDNLFCLPDEQSPFRNPMNFASSRWFLLFNMVWFSLSLGVTGYYLLYKNPTEDGAEKSSQPDGASTWWLYLRSWCIAENMRNFFAPAAPSTPQTSVEHDGQPVGEKQSNKSHGRLSKAYHHMANRVNLSPLEGLKFLGTLTVIASHSNMLIIPNSWDPQRWHQLLARSWLVMAVTVYPSTVNIFFVVTGVINARQLILLTKGTGQLYKPSFWLKFFLYRYIRIVPLYLLANWFLQSSFRFLGSGPNWDYGTSHSAWNYGCQKESLWWTVLVPSANFISPSVHCEGVGWYLANDLQFALLTPLFLVPMWSKPLLGHLVTWTTVLLGVFNHYNYYLEHDPEPRGLLEYNDLMQSRVTDETMSGYINPQYRFVAYAIGLSAGHLLVLYEQGEIKKWPKAFVRYGKLIMYLFSYLICFMPFISSMFLDLDAKTVRVIASLEQSCTHLLSSLVAAIFVMLITTGHYHKSVANFLGSRVFKVLANMSLSASLMHIPVIFYHSQSIRSLVHLNHHDLQQTVTFWILESLLLAAVVHILYELPLRRFLVKILLSVVLGKQQPAKLGASNGTSETQKGTDRKDRVEKSKTS